MLGMRVPLPSQALHPMVQPWENQKHDCPALHSEVPLLQLQVYGSIVPVGGNLPCDQAGRSASTELRDGGMIMEPWADTVTATVARTMARSIVAAAKQSVRRFLRRGGGGRKLSSAIERALMHPRPAVYRVGPWIHAIN